MTGSKTATGRLREMLDERGVEWRTGLDGVTFVSDWCFVEYGNGKLAATCEPVLTPEQAIAATPGSDVHAGRLAERLHDLADEMRNTGASSTTPHELLAFFAREIDKMADSLMFAATLGSGECEWELEHSGTLYDKWRCSECKFLFVEPRCDQGYTDLEPNFCPNCGKAVKR